MAIKNYFEQIDTSPEWIKEANVWATFYMTFNDDNEKHMEQAFFNNGGYDMTTEELYKKNVDWVRQIGLDLFWKYNSIPELESYANEYLFDSLGPGYNEVMQQGEQLLSKTSKNGDKQLDIYSFKDNLYVLITNTKTSENLSYTTVDEKRNEYPNDPLWKELDEILEERDKEEEMELD